MKKIRSLITGCMTIGAATVLSSAHAATPTSMRVAAEVINDAAQDLHMTFASWDRQGTELSSRLIPAHQSGTIIKLTFGNPRNGAATFRYATAEGKSCEFKLAHVARFQLVLAQSRAREISFGKVDRGCSSRMSRGGDCGKRVAGELHRQVLNEVAGLFKKIKLKTPLRGRGFQ
jgi:hypothetical protein